MIYEVFNILKYSEMRIFFDLFVFSYNLFMYTDFLRKGFAQWSNYKM